MLGRALHDAGDTDGAIAAFRKAIPLLLPISPAPGTWPGPWPRGAGWRRPVPSGNSSWKRLPRLTTPGTATPRFAHSSATRKRTAGPARPSSNASRDSTDHWAMAERDSLACLLRPASAEELRRAVALVDRAVATGPKLFPDNGHMSVHQGTGGVSSGPTSASRAFAARVGGTPPQPRRSAVGAGHGPVPIRLPGGSTQDTGGRRPGLQLDGVSGGPPHGVGQPRASPRGRGPDPAEPAGVPSGRV